MKYSCLISFTFPENSNSDNYNSQTSRAAISKFFNVFTLTLEMMGGSRTSVTPNQLGLNLSYDLEADSVDGATQKAQNLIKKLNLLASIEEGKEVTPFTFHSILTPDELSSITGMDDLFYGITPKQIEEFLRDSNYTQLFVLIEAFRDLKTDRILDAFPKFVNWLDYHDYDKAPQQKFCVVRTALSHTELRTTELVKQQWPKLKFENNMFVRDQENENQLLSMMPELLSLVKERFHNILKDYVKEKDDELSNP